MIKKETEKNSAIELRKKGFSYNEILKEIPVAKSTLSLWLRDIGLARRQQQKLTEKRRLAQQKAQEACRNYRIGREKITIETAKKEVTNLSKKDLWLIGTVLYWAEGSKQKAHNISQRVSFSNSDPRMIILFDKWMKEICKCSEDKLAYSIYIHKTADREKSRLYWEKLLHTKIDRIYFKNHKVKTNRKNLNEGYNGLVRIDVKRSTDLNRKIAGWIMGITEKLDIQTGP